MRALLILLVAIAAALGACSSSSAKPICEMPAARTYPPDRCDDSNEGEMICSSGMGWVCGSGCWRPVFDACGERDAGR